MKRVVPIVVTNDEVGGVAYETFREHVLDPQIGNTVIGPLHRFVAPVPPDEQLTKDLRTAVSLLQSDSDDFAVWARECAEEGREIADHFRRESERMRSHAARIRAAFQLDEVE